MPTYEVGTIDGRSIEVRHLSPACKEVLVAAMTLEVMEQRHAANGGKGQSAYYQLNLQALERAARAWAAPNVKP